VTTPGFNPEFPRDRFLRAGADEAQVEQLADEFASSDLVAQASLAESWATMSEGMLREHLRQLDEAGHFTTEPEAEAEGDESTLQRSTAGEPSDEGTASKTR
jgi:hypothetical protein